MATASSSWAERDDEEKEELALGATIGMLRRHERIHGDATNMTVQRKRGGKRNKNRMNVIVLNLHSEAGSSRNTLTLPR